MLISSFHSTKPAPSAGRKVSPAISATPAASQRSRRARRAGRSALIESFPSTDERPGIMAMRSAPGALVLGEQQQLRLQPERVVRRLSLFPGGALAAHHGDELALLVLETTDLEGERDDGAQVGGAERLADEPVDLAF